jgi:hypothetical protein
MEAANIIPFPLNKFNDEGMNVSLSVRDVPPFSRLTYS